MPTILTTGRLLLREFTEDDAADFHALNSNPEVIRYTGDGGTTSVEHARQGLLERPLADYRKHGFGRLACLDRASGRLIGFCGLKYLDELAEVDLGYRFLPEFWGRGLATEAGRAVLDLGFTVLRLERIIGLVEPENVRSVRVLEKLGMTSEGTVVYRGDTVLRYWVTRETYLAGGTR